MAITTIPAAFWPPPPPGVLEGVAPAFVSGLLDAADEAVANACQSPAAGPLEAIWGAFRTVTTGTTLEGRAEGLSGGVPSGALIAANADGTLVVLGSDDNSIFRIPINVPPILTLGQTFAPMFKNPTASPGTLNITQGTAPGNQSRLPYGLSNVSGSWSPFAANSPNLMALEIGGVIYGIEGVHPPASAAGGTVLNTGTSPDIIGALLVPAAAVRANGGWIWMDMDGDANVRLVTADWDGTPGNALTTVPLLAANRNSTLPGLWRIVFPEVSLAANVAYRYVIEPSTGTSITTYDFTMNSLAMMNAWAGGWCLTHAKDPVNNGSWTNHNSGTFRHFYGGLRINGLDIASSPGLILGGGQGQSGGGFDRGGVFAF